MSAPEAKAFSSPAMTMQRTVSSSSRFSSAPTNSDMSLFESAFRASGRFSRTTAMGSSRSRRTVTGR